MAARKSTAALNRVRALCNALPEVTERLSHGAPCFFVRDKSTFVMFLDDHHGDGRLALWCAAPAGAQEALIVADGERFFPRRTSVTAAGSACASTSEPTGG